MSIPTYYVHYEIFEDGRVLRIYALIYTQVYTRPIRIHRINILEDKIIKSGVIPTRITHEEEEFIDSWSCDECNGLEASKCDELIEYLCKEVGPDLAGETISILDGFIVDVMSSLLQDGLPI